MKMKKYQLLEVNVTYFAIEDVIRTSQEGSGNDWGIGELPFEVEDFTTDK